MKRALTVAAVVLAAAGAILAASLRHTASPRFAPAAAAAPRSPRPAAAPVHRGVLPAQRLGLPPVAPGPVPGYVLIADRNAEKLLVVSPAGRIVWQFPRQGDLQPGQSFHDPDDAFFTPGYQRIVTNEEFNDSIAQIGFRSHRIAWSYGRAGVAGAAAGELSNPDDAYVWPNRTVTVADIKNCRVLRLAPDRRLVSEIGTASSCGHDPPRTLSSPNGATPVADGGMLVTEIGGWVDRFDRHDRLLWSIRTPTTYPSDAQLLPDGNVLVAGFDTPGRVDEITPKGRIVWTYGPPSGPGALDRPSLAVRWPNGMIAVTDDWHHRIVVIDPRSKRIVWQYGHPGVASAAAGYLDKPDGLDLLPSAVTATRVPAAHAPALRVRRAGTLPASVSRIAAEALPDGRILAAGGLVGGTSSTQILLGPPGRLRPAGRLPVPTHDAALAGGFLFGGGEAVSTNTVTRIDERGRAHRARPLGEPLSDLGAVSFGRRIYLVGGYTGAQFASAVLRYRPNAPAVVVARLPAGLRYAGVAALGGTIYVVGGVTTSGDTGAVLAVDPRRGTVRVVARLPEPVAHAPLAALDGALYLVGGTNANGSASRQVWRIDPASGSVTRAALLPAPLADAAAVTSRGRIVVIGGGTADVLTLERGTPKG